MNQHEVGDARVGVFAEQGEARVIPAAPAIAAPVPTPLPAGCRATLRASFHLRAAEQVEAIASTSLPAGVVDVLRATSLLRAGARLYRVRTASGATGFAFVRAEEFASGCVPP